jgi:hypothetical protein
VRGTGVQVGVEGTGRTGVKATGTASIGVDATGATTGVKATSTDGVAVDASGKTGGVNAYSSDAVAVRATSGAVNGRGLTAYADQAGSQGIFAFGATEGIVAQGANEWECRPQPAVLTTWASYTSTARAPSGTARPPERPVSG